MHNLVSFNIPAAPILRHLRFFESHNIVFLLQHELHLGAAAKITTSRRNPYCLAEVVPSPRESQTMKVAENSKQGLGYISIIVCAMSLPGDGDGRTA